MPGTTFTTASHLRAMLCYIDPENTPKIAADRDNLALPLIERIKRDVGDRDGSQSVWLTFGHGEEELEEEFEKVARNMAEAVAHFANIVYYMKRDQYMEVRPSKKQGMN